MNVLKASEYLLDLANTEGGFDITNMKLQKLLYYLQGTSLALHNKRIFEESIIKWQYGPVVPEAYHYYKSSGSQLLTPPTNVNWASLNEEEIRLFNEVFNFFGQFSAIKLMEMTHNESPWINTEMSNEIGDEILKEYFETIIIKDSGEK